MIVGGNSHKLAVFLTDIWEMVKVITLAHNVSSIRKLEFISRPFDGGSNRLLAILTGNGFLYFYDMEADGILDQIYSQQEIVKITTSYNGKYVACNLSSGEINVYNISNYLKSSMVTLSKESQKTKALKQNCLYVKYVQSQVIISTQ